MSAVQKWIGFMQFTLSNVTYLGTAGRQVGHVAVSGNVFSKGAAGRSIDASGYTILPGLIDLHGDGFEHHMAPRRGAVKDLANGLRATCSELAVNGITTAVMAQFYSWEGGMRGPDFAGDVFALLRDQRTDTPVDIIPQLRFLLIRKRCRCCSMIPKSCHLIAVHSNLPYTILRAMPRTLRCAKGQRSSTPRLSALLCYAWRG